MTDKKALFRQKAEQLAQVEAQILAGADYSAVNPLRVNRTASRPTQALVWLGVAAAGGALFALWGDGGVRSLVFGLVGLAGLFKAYLAWSSFRANRAEEAAENQITGQVTQWETQRAALRDELNRMRRDDASLQGVYWWDKDKNPAVAGKLLPGKVPGYDRWRYDLLNPAYLNPEKGGVFLEDMRRFPVLVPGGDVRALLASQSAPQAVVYRDPALLDGEDEVYRIMKLYAYTDEPIQEIEARTTRTRVDKEAQWNAYQQKLDQMEIGLNAVGSRQLMTNMEMYLTGQKDVQEFARDQVRRGILESAAQSKIQAQDDWEERTTYRKVFQNLHRLTFVCCADVYLSCREGSAGRVAAIAVPRAEQSILRLTVRTPGGDVLGGMLEDYGGSDGVENGGTIGKLSIEMAADWLLNGEARGVLQLKPRDVLAPRPAGLDDYEWAYLIWKDRP